MSVLHSTKIQIELTDNVLTWNHEEVPTTRDEFVSALSTWLTTAFSDSWAAAVPEVTVKLLRDVVSNEYTLHLSAVPAKGIIEQAAVNVVIAVRPNGSEFKTHERIGRLNEVNLCGEWLAAVIPGLDYGYSKEGSDFEECEADVISAEYLKSLSNDEVSQVESEGI